MTEAVEIGTERWRAEVAHYLPLIARVIVQTQRRVLDGEIVPASEKLVSLFEPHADIIVKGGRQVQYGHKLNLATGKSGLILDIVIETGDPADAERFVSMLDRSRPSSECRFGTVAEGPSKAAALVEVMSAVIAVAARSTAWLIVLRPERPYQALRLRRTAARLRGLTAALRPSGWHSCLRRHSGSLVEGLGRAWDLPRIGGTCRCGQFGHDFDLHVAVL